MVLASVDMFGSIPLAAYVIARNAKIGVIPWKSWADTHYNYSRVMQIPAFVWKNDPVLVQGLEMYRWVLVACAFVFFAFFGCADEARRHYRLAYTSLASRIGSLGLSSTLPRASHTYVIQIFCFRISWTEILGLTCIQHSSHEGQTRGRDHGLTS